MRAEINECIDSKPPVGEDGGLVLDEAQECVPACIAIEEPCPSDIINAVIEETLQDNTKCNKTMFPVQKQCFL